MIYVTLFLSVAIFQLQSLTTVAQPAKLHAMPTSNAIAFSGSCCYGEKSSESASGSILYSLDISSPGISCNYGDDFSASQPGDCPSYAYACPADGGCCGDCEVTQPSASDPMAQDPNSIAFTIGAATGTSETAGGPVVSSTIVGAFSAGVAVMFF